MLRPYKVRQPRYPRWTAFVGSVLEVVEGLARILVVPFGYEVDWTLRWSGWILRNGKMQSEEDSKA